MKNKGFIAVLAAGALLAAGVWAQEAKMVSSGKALYGTKCAS